MNDFRIPDLGLGTFRLTGQTVIDSVRTGLELGYRATENLGRERLLPSLRESLAKLRVDAVDLTLIHWPSPGGAVSRRT